MEVRYYRSASGREPVRDYIEGLDAAERAPLLAMVLHLFSVGFDGLDVKPLRGKLWEVRVTRHRVFYVAVAGPTVVLLHADKKQGQRAPPRELATAERRMREVLGS